MQSTPVRASVIALGTLSALAAYGLGRSSASTADKQSSPNRETKKPAHVPVLLARPVSPIAAPELFSVQPSSSTSLSPTASPEATGNSINSASSKPPTQFASLRKLPSTQTAATTEIRRINVDQVPIDAVIASAFPRKAAAPAQPTAAVASIQPSKSLPTSTLPAANSAIIPATEVDESAYTLGSGDRIRVEVFNVPEYSREYQVLVNGIVNLYLVGPLSVRGMTPIEAQAAIAAKYAPILEKARVDVTLLAPRPVRVAISGEISRPGAYNLNTQDSGNFPKLTQIIQQAGGITQAADLRQIQIRRPQRSKPPILITANLWELAQSGDLRQDLTLRDGDTILIPTNSSINLAESSQIAAANFTTDVKKALNITVIGEVMRPGPIILASGTGGLPTLTQALQQAGGITSTANIREVEVRRPTRSGTTQSTRLNLWQILESGDTTQDLPLQQGDTIVVPKGAKISAAELTKTGSSSLAPTTIRVNIVGEVESPGAVQVPANTPLNQALLAAGGFNRRANRGRVQLLRLNPDGSVSRQAVSIDIARGIDEQGNPILRNNDVILVDRSGAAKVEDTIDRVGGFLGKLFPLGFLFR